MKIKTLLLHMVIILNILVFSLSSVSAETEGIYTYTVSNDDSTIADSALPAEACGKTATWSLDSNGVLTISGTGAMLDYSQNASPWEADRDKVREIVIEEGITHIGKYAFQSCVNVMSVRIPSSLTSIGLNAFAMRTGRNVYITDLEKWCSVKISNLDACPFIFGNLYVNNILVEHLVIPETVTELSSLTFWACSSIKEVTIHENLVGDYGCWFGICPNLQRFNVSENNTKYCSVDGHLLSKDKTIFFQHSNGKTNTQYTIPATVKRINRYAFYGSKLKSVTVPEGVEEIGSLAFYDSALQDITLPGSLKTIGQQAFFAINLSTVNYNSDETAWNKITIESGNDALLNAIIKTKIKETVTTVSADGRSFTIKPINIENGKTVILALYDGDKFVGFQKATCEGEEITFTTTKSYTHAKVMVWDDLTKPKPVCKAEEKN